MAPNPQNRKDAEEIRELVQDTLISISASMSQAIRTAIDEAVDGVDVKLKDVLGKDLIRSMTALAKASKDSANNQFRLNAGLLTSKNIAKQLQSIEERRLTLAREILLAKRNGISINEQEVLYAEEAITQEEALLRLEQAQVAEVEKRIGLTGKLVNALSKIPGLGQFVDAKEIEQEMRRVAATGSGTFQTMGVAARMVGNQLYEGLLDPLTLITAVGDGFLKVDKAATEFTRLTGQSTAAIASMNSNLASTVDILEVSSNLTKEIGVAGNNLIPPSQLAALAETKNLLGLSAQETTKLAIQTKLSGQNVEKFRTSVKAGVNQSNLQNKTGVEYGVILKDILNTSEDITMSLGNNPEQLGRAATAARAFGLNLNQVDQIAGSLLNFEDSIGNELQAQLLLGKNINLSKARELALNNDLEGVANELAKNGASAAEFSQMNRIQQEGLAKALGMSREQLAKSILAQEASKSLSEKQKADILGITEAEYERLDVQNRIQTSLDKIAQAFAPILEKIVVPLVEKLTALLNLPLVPYFLAGAIAAKSLGGNVISMATGMFSFGKSILSAVKNFDLLNIKQALFGKMYQGGQFLPGGGRAPAGGQRVGGLLGNLTGKSIQPLAEVGDKTKNLTPAAGSGIKSFFTGLGQGFISFAQAMAVPTPLGPVGLVMAVSLAAITGAIIGLGYAFKVAAPGMEAFGKVITATFTGLGTVITAVADSFVKILGAVTLENIGPMLLLGPALFGVAAGLAAISATGLLALPAIGGLVLLSKAAPGLVSLGMGGDTKLAGSAKEKTEETDMTEMLNVLQEIKTLIKQGGDIYMDTNKVGRALTLGTYKLK